MTALLDGPDSLSLSQLSQRGGVLPNPGPPRLRSALGEHVVS